MCTSCNIMQYEMKIHTWNEKFMNCSACIHRTPKSSDQAILLNESRVVDFRYLRVKVDEENTPLRIL